MKLVKNVEYDIQWVPTDTGFAVRINGAPVIDASFFAEDQTISLRVRNGDKTFLRETEPFREDEDDNGVIIDRRFQLISTPDVKEVY